jgi:bifunctional non-homologous end joining protein LigD
MSEPITVALAYKDGGSDKVYTLFLKPKDGGFVVEVTYGRRGGALKAESKTPEPVDYATAEKILRKQEKAKRSGGYSDATEPDGSAKPFSGTDFAERKSQYAPQLLNHVTKDQLDELLGDDGWVLQEKHDGERLIVVKADGAITGVNKKGLTRPIPQEVHDAYGKYPDGVYDGELVGSVHHVFDLIEAGPYHARLKRLEKILNVPDAHVLRVETSYTSKQKMDHFARITSTLREGIVLSDLSSAYKPGRPNSGGPRLKCKMWQSASCIVLRANTGKRSVVLGLIDGDATLEVGSCTIPANHVVPTSGEVVEVQYLKAYEGGSLYQPQYKGPRNDVDKTECTTAQIVVYA